MYIRAERKATGRRPKVGNPKVGNGECRPRHDGGKVECSASGMERRGSFYIYTTSSLPPEGVTSARPNARFKQGPPLSPHPTICPALEIPISRFLHSLPTSHPEPHSLLDYLHNKHKEIYVHTSLQKD